MKAQHVKVSMAELQDPASSAWGQAESESVALQPVPLDAQPTEYIRSAWAERAYGQIAEARVAALRDADRLYVRLEWAPAAGEGDQFGDAAAVLFGSGEALATLGSGQAPLPAWYWEETRPAPLALTSSGPGVVSRNAVDGIAAQAAESGGRWSLVLSGPLSGTGSGLGVALWNGSNDERAGLAAVSRAWLPLEAE